MVKLNRGYKQIILSIPEDIFNKATHSLKIKGNELKDYLMDIIERTVTVEKGSNYSRDPIWNIVGLGKSKVKDLSVRHDKYLYRGKAR